MDPWQYRKTLPDEMVAVVDVIFKEQWEEYERLENFRDAGSPEEKSRAVERLAQLGVPGAWFHRRVAEKYPDLTREQTDLLFAWLARANL